MHRIIIFLFSQYFLLDGTNIFTNASPLFGKNLFGVTNTFGRDKFPFVASIGTGSGRPDDDHFCTGVLISRRHILTAAHCKMEFTPNFRVLLGSELLENGKKYKPISFMSYADWSRVYNLQYDDKNMDEAVDIAIITLSEDVDRSISHASFSNKRGADFQKTKIHVVSWSANKMEDYQKHKLLGFVRPVTSEESEETKTLLKAIPKLKPEGSTLLTVAVGDTYLNEGDSGSPLFDQENRLVAIFSTVYCKERDQYSLSNVNIHTLIQPYMSFINYFIAS